MADLITPPNDLVRDWARFQNHENPEALWRRIATLAARWGADQELEACCEWFADDVVSEVVSVVAELRVARRPKPPSLKLQALNDLNTAYNEDAIDDTTYCNIRRALEALPND